MRFEMKNRELEGYLFDIVVPNCYDPKDTCHGVEHIEEVIKHALTINNKLKNIVDRDLLITACVYHDAASNIDRSIHHIISGEMVRKDRVLAKFICKENIELVALACEEHRSSNKEDMLSSMLSMIVADADSCDGIMDFERMIERSYHYHGDIDDMYKHLSNKYGKAGYSKYYLQETSDMIKKSRDDIRCLCNDKEQFKKTASYIIDKNGLSIERTSNAWDRLCSIRGKLLKKKDSGK